LSRCRGVVEVEAESVAYVVCSALGVDSSDYSLPYVASWSGGDLDKVAATAERVVRCAHRILTQLEEGRDLEQPQPARPIAAHRGGGVGDALEAAVAYYVEQLESQSASHAREYLAGRGIDPETVARWRLGYAPPGWEQLVGALGDAGFDEDLLVDAGLASRSRRGRLYDWMRGRIVFPVFDTDGRPRGFAGRLLDGEGPKYLNSPETDLYSKRRLLYGLDLARSSIEETGSCVVVEGYTDAIAAHHAGVTNTVATGGTALTSEHLASLRPLAATVTLCFDGDDGGRCAARRVSELPVASLTGLELRVASLPAGQDPASLVATGTPGVLRHLVARAVPLVESLITDVLDGHNLDEPEDAVRAIRAAGEVIARLTSTDTRDAAVSYLARTSGRSEQLVEQATGMTRGVGATTERATQR
jgi:DNA primase